MSNQPIVNMDPEQTQVREQAVPQSENGLESTGGVTRRPPALTFPNGGPAGQTIAAPAALPAVTLTPEQLTAARGFNAFLLGEAAAINAVQTALGVPNTGQFDDPTLNAIAGFQTQQAFAQRLGKMNRETLDRLVRALVTASNFDGVAAIARDFFRLDERATAVPVSYNATLTSAAALNAAGTLEFGPTAFTDGLTSLGTAVEAAMGAGSSIADQSWGVLEAETAATRRTAMWNRPNAANEAGLAVWVREHFPTEASIREYLNRTDVTEAVKVATLGRLSVELGRLEFLMGVIYHGGTDQSWESTSSNNGPFVNHYKAEVGNTPNDAPWCTMFSGYLRRMLGFSATLADGGPLVFNSGMRLDRWATDNTNLISGRDDFDDPADYENYSGGSIDRDEWVTLRTTLNRRGITAPERQQALTTFLSTRITPQPGDIMVVNNSSTTNDYSGTASHTINVESYSGTTVSTIEGNKGHKVTGTTLDLSNPTDVAKVIILARVGMEFFPHDAPAPVEEGAEAAPAVVSNITAESLLQPLQAMTRELQMLASRRNYISSDTAGASVTTMAGANSGGGDR
jgi:hypothetical protein